jgi:membrane-bound lytic murein transglycosylase A
MTRPIYSALSLLLLAGCERAAAPNRNSAPLVAGTVTTPTPTPTPTPTGPTAPPPCTPTPVAPAAETILLGQVEFSTLGGWSNDHVAEAVPAFLQSCERIAKLANDKPIGVDGYSGKASEWRAACTAAKAVRLGRATSDADARAFFEKEFTPYRAASSTATGFDGKLTGYCVQPLRASKKRGGAYQAPIYARPKDLISVDLGKFISDGKGRTVWGRVDNKTKTFEHYASRAEIRQGLLANRKLELLWADDKLDVLFAEIEGSAVVTLDDGSKVWLEVDGKTSRPYRGVGKILRDMGTPPGTGSMQGIRKWFAANPERFDEIVDQNESFVFFKKANKTGAQGSQGVTLTAQRSAAIDRAFIAYSTPMWIDTTAPVPNATTSAPLQRLVIAQDTGGGIKGPVRADIYWGEDPAAVDVSGRMNSNGGYYLLLPKKVVVPAAFLAIPSAAASTSTGAGGAPAH